MILFLPDQLVDSPLLLGIALVISFGVLFLITWVIKVVLDRWIKKLAEGSATTKTTYKYFERLIVYAVAVLGAAMIIFAFFPGLGATVASLFIAAGFASIVLGLAAQSTLQNIFAGLALSASQPFKINDAVFFKDEFCFVEDLRLTHTILRTWDNRRLMVPNSVMQSETFVNYTINDPVKLVPVILTISHESDCDKAMEIMLKAAKQHPDALPIGDLPKVVVMDLDSTGVKLRLLTRAKDQPTAFGMARDLMKVIKTEFDKGGIVIPYPRTHLILDKESARELRAALGRGGGEKEQGA